MVCSQRVCCDTVGLEEWRHIFTSLVIKHITVSEERLPHVGKQAILPTRNIVYWSFWHFIGEFNALGCLNTVRIIDVFVNETEGFELAISISAPHDTAQDRQSTDHTYRAQNPEAGRNTFRLFLALGFCLFALLMKTGREGNAATLRAPRKRGVTAK